MARNEVWAENVDPWGPDLILAATGARVDKGLSGKNPGLPGLTRKG